MDMLSFQEHLNETMSFLEIWSVRNVPDRGAAKTILYLSEALYCWRVRARMRLGVRVCG